MHHRTLTLAWAALLAACAGLAAPLPPEAPRPAEPTWPPPPGDACASPPGSLARPVPAGQRPLPAAPRSAPRAGEAELDAPLGPAAPDAVPPPPVAGQMTEQAAQAKRLFDAERWVEAERSLARVVAGDTGDDEGNRHLAEYHAAIAIYRQARHAEAAARFRVITRRPSHLKFNETLLWLIELARDDRTLVQIADFAPYTDEHAAKFNNANQRVLFGAASYLVGRARYDEGRLQDAEPMFFHAASQEPWAAHARQCLTRVRQHRGR